MALFHGIRGGLYLVSFILLTIAKQYTKTSFNYQQHPDNEQVENKNPLRATTIDPVSETGDTF